VIRRRPHLGEWTDAEVAADPEGYVMATSNDLIDATAPRRMTIDFPSRSRQALELQCPRCYYRVTVHPGREAKRRGLDPDQYGQIFA
jgi:hypothetical protein